MAASSKPNNSIPAPKADQHRGADWWEHIADISSGDVDLRQRAFGGNHAAQVVRLFNATAGTLVAKLLQELPSGVDPTNRDQSVSVPAGQAYEVPRPIRKIIASGSGALQADCFWFFASNTFPNPE